MNTSSLGWCNSRMGMRLHFLLICLMTSVGWAGAQYERINWTQVLPNISDSVVSAGDTVSLKWEPQGIGTAVSYGMSTLVQLKNIPQVREVIPSYDARVIVQISLVTNPDHGSYDPNANDTLLLPPDTLMIGYRRWGILNSLTTSDSLLSRSLDSGGRRSIIYQNAHEVHVELLDLELDLGSGYADTIFPKNLLLDLRMDWDLVRDLDPAPAVLSVEGIDCLGDNSAGSATDEIHISWTTVPGAFDYHLEWTWVDNYDANGTANTNLATLNYDLQHNSTRIVTTQTEYHIPVLFDQGYLIFRVRAMGRDPLDPTKPIYGQWDWQANSPYLLSDVPATSIFPITQPVRHRADLNWQVTNTFAEEGKRKEVMTYADGTLRSRQVVTRNNSLNVPIIGETVYDIVGRPALEIMPVPLVRNQECPQFGTGSVILAPINYYEKFNAEEDNTPNALNQDLNHLDLLAEGECGVTSVPLDPDNGAELYYSENHLSVTGALTGYPSFLPRAEGKPYAQTEYTRDNTGRIRRKGGVGETFQLGQGHETKFFYGKPTQISLDRLFGSEAGYAEHYRKDVVIDANGQGSVSYINRNGQTIATALIGECPSDEPGLLPISSYNAVATELTTDLFNGQNSLACDMNDLVMLPGDPGVPALVFIDEFSVVSPGEYTFLYDLVVPQVANECLEVCLHCRYDLEVRLTDECGAEYWHHQEIVGEYLDGSGNLRFTCIPEGEEDLYPVPLTYSINNPGLPQGEYVLTKTLKLRTEGLNAYLEELLGDIPGYIDPLCVTPWEELLATYLNEVDLSGCDIGCEACYDAVGTLDDFLATGGSEDNYHALLQQCDDQCREKNWCEVAYLNMLSDMGQNGQYAEVQLTSNNAVVSDRASVYWHNLGSWSILAQRFTGTTTIDFSKPLWRQPRLLVNGIYVSEYRDDQGDRTKIILTPLGGNTYQPAVVSTGPGWVFEEGGTYFTYPENLVNLADFILAKQSGWERSLIFYHPEYCYWLECKGYDELLLDETISTDEFDGRLRVSLDPVADGFMDANGVVTFIDPNAPLYDPIFAHPTAYNGLGTELAAKFASYMEINGTPFTMPQAAALMVRCAGDYTMMPGAACLDFGAPGSAPEILEQEWAALKGMYLGEKYRIQKAHMDNAVSDCSCSGVNWCIGSENEENNSWQARMHNYPSNYSFWTSWYNMLGHQFCQPCSHWTYGYYDEKVRLFAEPSQFGNANGSMQDAGLSGYLGSGLCPMASAWQGLFHQMFANDQVTQNGLDLSELAGYQTVYLISTNYAPSAPTPNDLWVENAPPTATSLSYRIVFADASPSCVVDLSNTVVDAATDFWSDIVQVFGMTVNGNNSFILHVRYLNNNGQFASADISGQMGGCFNLYECNFPQTCTTNDLGFALQELLGLLALNDGSPEHLASTGTLDLSSQQLLPGGTLDMQEVILPALTAPFGTGTLDLKWKWDGVQSSWYLAHGSTNAPRWVIKILGVSTSVGFNHMTDLPSVEFVEGLVSGGYNLFDVQLYDANHDLLGTLHGQLFWEPSTGVFEDRAVGECSYAEAFGCTGPEYTVMDDLAAVLNDLLPEGGPNYDDIDLSSSPYMTSYLWSQLCPGCDPLDIQDPGGTMAPTVKSLRQEFNLIVADLGDGCPLLTFPGVAFTSLGDPVPSGPQDLSGAYHQFTLTMYNGSTVVGTMTVDVPCLDILECDCPELPEEQEELTVQELLAAGLIHEEDEKYNTWLNYAAAVDGLNSIYGYAPSDSLFVPTIDFGTFYNKGYDIPAPSYIKFLINYDPLVDDHRLSQDIDLFILLYGYATNVRMEFERYQKAIDGYNARALAMSLDTLTKFDYGTFAEMVAADIIDQYIDHLRELPTSSENGEDLDAWLDLQDIDHMAECKELYVDEYAPAYLAFEAAQQDSTARCPKYAIYSPFYSVDDFISSNLCCSDTGLLVLENYVASLLDTTKCPSGLPLVKFCLTNTNEATMADAKELEPDCEKIYIYWQDRVKRFNETYYVDQTHDSLPTRYYKDYRTWLSAGLCDCTTDYLEYLETYERWSGGPLPDEVLVIDEYGPCRIQLERLTDPCSYSYNTYYNGMHQFREWLAENSYSCQIYLADSRDFTAEGLCYCVEPFLQHLEYIMSDGLLTEGECASTNIHHFDCSPPDPCDPDLPPFTPIILPPEENPCEVMLLNLAHLNAQHDHEQQILNFTQQLTEDYYTTCMQALERFEMTYPDPEHHFTLYYYDQAGNLIRTIPPEGVELLSFTDCNDPLSDAIESDRNNGTHSVFTAHRMPSDHIYNSLNNPIRQDMPDHEKMDIWETDLPSGLPKWLQITNSDFPGGGKGWLTGFRQFGNLQRGYVYMTTDGGASWDRVIGLVASDLNNVHFPTSSVGYAVGRDGLLLKTVDGGSSWDMISYLANVGELFDVHFINASVGIVTGTSGRAWITTNGFTGIPSVVQFPDADRLESITYDNGQGAFFVGGNTTDGQNGFVGRISGPPSFTTGVPGHSTAVHLNTVSQASTTSAFIAGNKGVLMYSSDSGTSWKTRRTGSTEDFRSIFFINDNDGLAIVDSMGIGVLRHTMDGGQTWIAIGKPGFDLNGMQEYYRTPGQGAAIAYGKQGLVMRVVLGTAGANFDLLPAPTSAELTSAWGGQDVNTYRGVVGDAAGNVHTCANLYSQDLQWSTATAMGVSVTSISGKAFNGGIGIVLVASDKRKRDGVYTISTNSWSWSSPSNPDYGLTRNYGPAYAAAYNSTTQQLEVYVLNTNFAPFQMVSVNNSGVLPTQGLNDFTFVGGLHLVGVGDVGSIHNSQQFTTSPTSSVIWNDRKWSVLPLPLFDLIEGAAIASGAQGNLHQIHTGGWVAYPTPRVEDIHGIASSGVDAMLVGEGKVHRVAFSTDPNTNSNAPGYISDLSLPQTVGLHDVLIRSNGVTYVAGDNGKIFHRTDPWTGTWTILNHNSGTINGLASRTGTSEVFAVGEHALVHRLFNTTRSVINDVFTPKLNDISFTPSGDGYVVGDGLIIRHTTDGGAYWNVVPPPSTVPNTDITAVQTTSASNALAAGGIGQVAELSGETWTPLTGFPSGTNFKAVAVAENGSAILAGQNGSNGVYHRRNAGGNFLTIGSLVMGSPLYSAWAFKPYYTSGSVLKNDFVVAGANGATRVITFNNGLYSNFSNHNITLQPGENIQGLFFHDHVAGYGVTNMGTVIRTDKQTTPDHSVFLWQSAFLNTNDGISGQTNTSLMDIKTIGFSDRHRGFMGGCYDCPNNPMAPPVRYARTLTDESGLYSSRFWYDKLGRIVLSQNVKQFSDDPGNTPHKYSYTLYDDLGRIEEAGEVTDIAGLFNSIMGVNVQGQFQPFTIEPDVLRTWVKNPDPLEIVRTEVVRTYYDEPLDPSIEAEFSTSTQDQLRLRVATTTYEDEDDGDPLTYQHATHYSYDIHGNVKEMLQDIPDMAQLDCSQDPLNTSGQMVNRFKRIEYTYDLISGNVLQVDYQDSKPDQFHHRYFYDADNRLESVQTSRNAITWREDARYFYYPHGPLARVEIGDNKVQGMDYAYTLQGWLKGINSETLIPTNDMGLDAVPGGVNEFIGRDVYGLTLGYYGQDDDFFPIDINRWQTAADRPFAYVAGDMADPSDYQPLFNGNIAYTVNSLAPFGGYPNAPIAAGQALATSYRYDQLNRLKHARGFDGLDASNDWDLATSSATGLYDSYYSYDANGNIDTVGRYDQYGVRYDSLEYSYHTSGAHKVRNRLYHVMDGDDANNTIVNQTDDGFEDYPYQNSAPEANMDLVNDPTGASNYLYDALGNLITDRLEHIDNIDWTVAGKVHRVQQEVGQGKKNLQFRYGADGNRVVKEVYSDQGFDGVDLLIKEYYIRDAQGNVMAIYRADPSQTSFTVKERPIYGSSRLGLDEYTLELCALDPTTYDELQDPSGLLRYELSDHLGNVTTVVTDNITGVDVDSDQINDYFQPFITAAQGYEPFGGLLPGRSYSSDGYRFAFNGMEKDDEVHGATGTNYDFGARLYDSRLGRWLSLDPLSTKYASQSPYSYVMNSPLLFKDEDGREVTLTIIEREGERPLIQITVTGKVLDYSNGLYANLGADANNILTTLADAGSYLVENDVDISLYGLKDGGGNNIQRADIQVVFDFEQVKSMSEVEPDDHLVVITELNAVTVRNNATGELASVDPKGISNENGGRVVFVNDDMLDYEQNRTVVHELFTHILATKHPVPDNDPDLLRSSEGSGYELKAGDLNRVVHQFVNKNVNLGSNKMTVGGRVMPDGKGKMTISGGTDVPNTGDVAKPYVDVKNMVENEKQN